MGIAPLESHAADEAALSDRIARIEHGLMPVVQIEGHKPVRFPLQKRLAELGVPGLSVAVVENGSLAWARSWGTADAATNRPMDTDTLLLAGSISKPVSALRALQLVDQGTIDLDRNINDYLRSWKLPDNEFTKTEKVTLRRILNHTAGLTVWGFPGYDKGDDVPSVVEVLEGQGNTGPVRVFREPGEGWLYSGGGTTIMQLMIMDLDGVSFPESLRKNVLAPLRMSASTFSNPLPEALHDRAATGYRASGEEVEGKWPIYPEMAAAGLWTNPSELIQYAIEIQRIFQHRVDGLLTYESVVEMLTPGLESFGLGPKIDEHTFSHGGADEGFRAQLVAWKDRPFAVVAMVNSDNGLVLKEFLLAVADEYRLPGMQQEVRKVEAQSREQLARFAGNYEMPEYETFHVTVDGDRLILESGSFSPPLAVLPQGDTEFFSVDDGEIVKFAVDDREGRVLGFDVWGLHARRVEPELNAAGAEDVDKSDAPR
ncbi:MAG: serine hydrolase [Pseudomonadota bacterium]